MHVSMPLIVTLATALGLALMLGYAAVRLKLPALVGYLLAGVLIGPHTPGFVADGTLAAQFAELGVMLLMFGVGLHFSLGDLLAVRRVALPGALVQMAVATLLGALLARAWGWGWPGALVFGLALSVASTVVLLRALEARGALATHDGRIAVGWLVVEDLAMVLVLVLLPALVGLFDAGGSAAAAVEQTGGDIAVTVAQTLLAVGAFVALMLLVGRRALPWALWQIAASGSRELFTLCVFAVAVGIAYGAAALFGVSVALGAFFAGLVLRESPLAHRAAEESLPFRDAFAVLFFVAVGMLFDPRVLLDAPLQVLAVTFVIVVGKSLAAAGLVLALRYPLSSALTVAASLAQIGEFSFILVALGGNLGLLPASAQSLIVAGALISMALNPLVFEAVEPLRRFVLARSDLARKLDARSDPLAELPATTPQEALAHPVVLVGYGRVGRAADAALAARGVAALVVDDKRERIEALRAAGRLAVWGDAREPLTLVQAHVARAEALVVALPEAVDARAAIDCARRLNPALRIAARAADDEAAAMLRAAGADACVQPEPAIAEQLVAQAMAPAAAGSSGAGAQAPAGA
jgi:CPA2 family monovalent cation:H+ antiporter-2